MRALKQKLWAWGSGEYCVTTQAHEGIETRIMARTLITARVTTQAHEGIETAWRLILPHPFPVTTQAHEGIETDTYKGEYEFTG